MHGGATGWCLQTLLAAALLHVLTAPELPGRLGEVGVPGYFGGVDQACVSAGAPEAACNTSILQLWQGSSKPSLSELL